MARPPSAQERLEALSGGRPFIRRGSRPQAAPGGHPLRLPPAGGDGLRRPGAASSVRGAGPDGGSAVTGIRDAQGPTRRARAVLQRPPAPGLRYQPQGASPV